MNKILIMMLEFFKTGLFAVGGGLATIPFLTEMSARYGWFTQEMLATMIAVSESTPGPIGINMATYVGYTSFGVLGGILATLSLVTPSVIVVCIIANMLEKFKNSRLIKEIFAGLRPAVVGLIISAVAGIFISTLFHTDAVGIAAFFNWKCIILYAIMLVFYHYFKKLHPIWIILICAAAGILLL